MLADLDLGASKQDGVVHLATVPLRIQQFHFSVLRTILDAYKLAATAVACWHCSVNRLVLPRRIGKVSKRAFALKFRRAAASRV